MNARRILTNVFSSWTNLLVSVVAAFVVSPILVRSLGHDLYGVWVLIVSLTGYFTVLDFGINTAIVRYVSAFVAQKDHAAANRVYSTSFAVFAGMGAVVFLLGASFGPFLKSVFGVEGVSAGYLYGVFLLVVVDFAVGLSFSVWSGSLCALQEYRTVNGIAIAATLTKNVVLVVLLQQGFGLAALAGVQLTVSLLRYGTQYTVIRSRFSFLQLNRRYVSNETFKLIISYSVYSFIISIALKILFYTDSIVIGSLLGVAEVTFYAIPSTLVDYLEKFVWSMIAVLIPVISANDASGEGRGNAALYVTGTRYALLICTPVVLALLFLGDDFLGIWMGEEFQVRSTGVLRLLLVGYGVSFSQLIAHGILKGTSRHRALAYILAVEAVANVGLSIGLARRWGIEGVAVGTMVPLIVATAVIAIYTARQVGVGLARYLWRGYGPTVCGVAATLPLWNVLSAPAPSYIAIVGRSALVVGVYAVVAVPLGLAKEHREKLIHRLCSLVAPTSA